MSDNLCHCGIWFTVLTTKRVQIAMYIGCIQIPKICEYKHIYKHDLN